MDPSLQIETEDELVQKQVSLLTLFKFKKLRQYTIFSCLGFFVADMLYYGISLSISTTGLNIYQNMYISQIFELVGYSIIFCSIHAMARKPYSIILFLICSIFCISFDFNTVPTDCHHCPEQTI